jgi:hypothetical protein
MGIGHGLPLYKNSFVCMSLFECADGISLGAMTVEIAALPQKGRHIHFIDTPGLNDT